MAFYHSEIMTLVTPWDGMRNAPRNRADAGEVEPGLRAYELGR